MIVEAKSKEQILRERALSYAQIPPSDAARGAELHIVEFRLAQERYGIETRWVEEVYPFEQLTPLPGTPNFVRGIVNVRGRILPVFDLERLFGLPERGLTDLHQIILVQGYGLDLGLLADWVLEARSIPVASLQPTLPTLSGIRADYLRGVTADRLVILDLARILSDPKMIIHDEVE